MELQKLTPAQAQIATDRHRFRVVNCGRRFGKTTLAVDQIKSCAVYREARIAYIAPTFQQARDIAWEQLKKDVANANAVVNESRLEIRLPNVHKTQSLIVLRGWESIETLRGQLFDLIVIDEVASMRNFWMLWQEVVRPTLTDRRGEAIFISTPKGYNHFYELYSLDPAQAKAYPGQVQDDQFKSFHFTSYDNPYIPQDEIDKAKNQLTEDRFAQEYMADFRKTEGLVYKEFDRETHVYDPKEILFATREYIVGVDFGYTNPAAIISIHRDPTDTYYVTAEYYKRGATDQEVVEYVSGLAAERVYPDPEAANAVELMRRARINVREVVKGKDSVKNGIQKVRELLKANKLKISSDCINLIQEFETYSYPDEKAERNEDENPIKLNDHALDALRYAITMNVGAQQGPAHQYRPGYIRPTHVTQAIGNAQPGVINRAHQYRPGYGKL